MKSTKRAGPVCPLCGGVGHIIKDGTQSRCTYCGATITVTSGTISSGFRKITARITGSNGDDVSKVVKQTLSKMENPTNKIHISGGSVGLLNTGEIKKVKEISINLGALEKEGKIDIVEAIKNLTESITQSKDLDLNTRTELLEQLEELSKQATLSPDQRIKKGTIKAILVGLAGGLAVTADLTDVWKEWGDKLIDFFK